MAWEYSFLNFIQEHIASPWLDQLMTFITHLSDGGAIWIIAAIIMLIIPKYRRHGVILIMVLIIGAVFNSLMLKPLIGRARPFEGLEHITLLITPPADASFPSGHTLVSLSSALVILNANKKLGIISLILAVLTAFSRMYLYVHFPTDILAGAILAAVISIICISISNKKHNQNKNRAE